MRQARRRPGIESLEGRELLALISVNAAQVVRAVDTQLLGANVAWYDSALNTSQTQQMVQAAGLTMFRFPGGSSSDDFHFNQTPTYGGEGTDASMAQFVSSVSGVGMATVDYGSGSPQEAAAFLAYLNGSVSDTTAIGVGQEWNDATSAWQQVDWKSAGYWASLRASAPLAQDDGLNFLRLDHTAPFDVHYWEIGNEEYGSWETDHHPLQHDPATYIAFAKQFASYAAKIDPTVSIGLDVGSPGDFNNWTANILEQSASQGLTVGFLSDHNYVQAPGSESDPYLLLDTVTDNTSDPDDPGNPYDWSVRAADYENLLTEYLGAAGKDVELLATEFNSVYSNPGKQSTSLVNGLFVADSLGSLLETPYDGALVWDLRNSYSTSGNNASSLYGWRQGGDYGLLGSPGGTAPSSGAYVPYPTYFAEELASKIIEAGGSVVQTSSSDPNLTAYTVLEANGHLELLVINKSAAGALTGQFQIANFSPDSQAQVWQYGEAQDTAQSQTSDGHAALAETSVNLTLSGSSFTEQFPAYSMTVLDLSKSSGSGVSGPVISQAAAAAPNPASGTTTVLSVTANDASGASGLIYTWTTSGTPVAPVHFSTNGTSAAQSVTATFAKAGIYSFVVSVADPGGLFATSSVTCTANPTLTTIAVNPGSITVAAGGHQQFSATAFDQFGDPLSSQPALSWSVGSGAGSIDSSTGVYTAPSTAGGAMVLATSQGVWGIASIAISPPLAATYRATLIYSLVSVSNKGTVASITITDTGTAALHGWTLQFVYAGRIRSVANARIARHIGKRYVIQPKSHDMTIEPGQSLILEFKPRRGQSSPEPTKYQLKRRGKPVTLIVDVQDSVDYQVRYDR
jgi:alpha-L-arabinofuranosidase